MTQESWVVNEIQISSNEHESSMSMRSVFVVPRDDSTTSQKNRILECRLHVLVHSLSIELEIHGKWETILRYVSIASFSHWSEIDFASVIVRRDPQAFTFDRGTYRESEHEILQSEVRWARGWQKPWAFRKQLHTSEKLGFSPCRCWTHVQVAYLIHSVIKSFQEAFRTTLTASGMGYSVISWVNVGSAEYTLRRPMTFVNPSWLCSIQGG